ncbi:MAG TPA: hypothetical protein PLI94_00010 [Bacillota bacterium]|nr:hypothetical protein [Bacillota bacterium]
MSDYTYRMTISGSGKGLASPIISKVSHFPTARLAIIIGGVAPGDTALMTWATKHRKHQPVARDDVELEIVYAGQTVRKITIKEAAVLGYAETYDAADGLGRFELVIQQHCFGDKEHCYVPVPQRNGSLLHVVYRIDLLYLDSLDELVGMKRKTLALHAFFAGDQGELLSFAGNKQDPFAALRQRGFGPMGHLVPFRISFSLIRWDRETVQGQLELDLTTDLGRKLLGTRYPVIQDRIGQLVADGYGAKDAMLENRCRTVGSKTVKCNLAEWYRVSAGEKRMKITAPRIKLEYNNIRPKETKGSGIPGILEFVKVAATSAAATAQAEAAPVVEVVTKETKLPQNVSTETREITKGEIKTTRDRLLESVTNPKLKNAINEMYRPGATIGDGGLADAIKHELTTGELVGGKSHIQKGLERIRNLENILRKETLSYTDREILENLLNNLKDVLKGVNKE